MSGQISQAFQGFYQRFIDMLPNLMTAIVLFSVFFFIGWLFQRIVKRAIIKRWGSKLGVGFSTQVIRWLFVLIGGIVALHAVGFGGLANSIVAGAGVSAIIVGFAFKDIAENFLAGFLLAISRPFNIGNIIEVGGFKGTVKGLDLRTTHIRNVEGKDFYIPNASIIKNTVINYTKDGLLRLDFIVGLDIPTKVEDAKKLILEYLQKQPEILKTPESNVITQEISEFTIDVKILFWIDVLKQKNIPPSYLGATIRGKIIREVKDLLLENGFNLPSQVLEHKMYNNAMPLLISQ